MRLFSQAKWLFRRKQPDELNYSRIKACCNEPIGTGRVSTTVYKGVWHGVTVAIKDMQFLPSQAYFDNEKDIMKMLTAFQSPHIIQYFGFAEAGPRMNGSCIIMEYVPHCLADVIEYKQPFPWDIRYSMITGLLSGIAFMHQQQIVHRDIKSQNVLLTQEWVVKICDFGFAKIMDSVIEDCGTVAWKAPETGIIAHSEKHDIYSAAVTIWEVASWQYPYLIFPSQDAITASVKRGERLPIPASCPDKLAKLIALGWAQKPEDRPTAEELLEKVKALN